MESRPFALGALCLISALTGSCGEGTRKSNPPLVLLIEVDTLRADFFGHTPFLDQLAASSLVFDSAHSTAPWTQPSIGSLMTGKWPWAHGATRLMGTLGDGHQTLAEAFAEGGFRTAGVSTNFLVKRAAGYAQGFEHWDESLGMGHEGSTGMEAADLLLEQYDALVRDDPGGPIFLYGLFFEPHWRYEPDQATADLAVTRYQDLGELRAALAKGELSAADLDGIRRLYTGEVERIDLALNRLAEGFKQRGVWERAVVVFTADHGEYLGEAAWDGQAWIGHTVDLSETLVRVPLWFRAPGLAAGHDAGVVSHVDLGATLLGLAGLDGKLGVGRSLLTDERRDEVFLHADFAPALVRADSKRKRTLMWGVIDVEADQKWVVDHLAEGGPRGMLFDLAGGEVSVEGEALGSLRGLVPKKLGDARGEEPQKR